MTPSSMPLCASIGPRTTSPTAQTFGTVVRHLLVDLDEAALVERHLDVGPEQAGRHGPAADGDDERVDVELLRRAARLVAHLDGVAFDGRARDLGAEPNVEPLLLQMAQRVFGDLLIGHRQERVERFQDHDLGAEPLPDASRARDR